MKKRILSLLLCAAVLCTACATGENDKKSDGENIKKNDKPALTVYMLKDDDRVWKSVRAFNIANPEYDVKVEVGISEEDSVTRTDAIKKLNTELMAGEGPDIIFLDGLPIESYIQKGILKDLSEPIETLEENGETLFENVASAYESEGKKYAVPAFFSVPIVVGEKGKVNSEDLNVVLKKGEKLSDELIQYLAVNWRAAVPMMLLTSWEQIFQGGEVDKELVKAFLENAKSIMENSEVDLSLEYYKEDPPFERMIGDFPSYPLAIHEISFGITSLMMGSLGTIIEDGAAIQSLNNQMEIFYQYLNQENGKKFLPEKILGISAVTANEEGAEKFVEYFLSAKNLSADNYKTNLSVNKTCVKKFLPQSEEKKYITSFGADMEMTKKFDIYEFNPEEAEEFLQFLDEAETPNDVEWMMLEMVLMETKKYVYEGSSLEDTINTIAQKMDIYQAE